MIGDADNFILGGQTGKGLVFTTNNLGQEKMRITVGGNVGIGTTNPQRQFVLSNGGAAGMELSSSSTFTTIISYNRSTSTWLPLVLQEGTGNVLIGTTTDAGQRLQVNGNLRIDNTLSSPGNLIETAGLNVYLRPASGYSVFIDSGNGLTVNGDIQANSLVRIGNSVQYTKFSANSNITTSITFASTGGFWANNAVEILVSRANNLAPAGMSKILVSMNQLNSSLSSVSTTTVASLGTGVSISTSVSGATITITLETHTDSASRSVAYFNVISYFDISVS
jgi:hypothetical protein